MTATTTTRSSTTTTCAACAKPFSRGPRESWKKLCPSCFADRRRSEAPRAWATVGDVWPEARKQTRREATP
jgi:hypothetical protein